jgi:hypothetical protein
LLEWELCECSRIAHRDLAHAVTGILNPLSGLGCFERIQFFFWNLD